MKYYSEITNKIYETREEFRQVMLFFGSNVIFWVGKQKMGAVLGKWRAG